MSSVSGFDKPVCTKQSDYDQTRCQGCFHAGICEGSALFGQFKSQNGFIVWLDLGLYVITKCLAKSFEQTRLLKTIKRLGYGRVFIFDAKCERHSLELFIPERYRKSVDR